MAGNEWHHEWNVSLPLCYWAVFNMTCPPVSIRWHCLEDNYVIFHTTWIGARLLSVQRYMRHCILDKWALCCNGKFTFNCHKEDSVSSILISRNHREYLQKLCGSSVIFVFAERLSLVQRIAASRLSTLLIQSALSCPRVNMLLYSWYSLSAGLDWGLVLLQHSRTNFMGFEKWRLLRC